MSRPFTIAFSVTLVAKVLAGILAAILAALGYDEKWAAWMISGLPTWITPIGRD
jgi:hypothetical protein